MDWGFITHHLVSGYIPVIAALVVYFILMHVIGKKQTMQYIMDGRATKYVFIPE